jgi:hypothetical protein
MKIYIASKTRHGKYWKQLRSSGVNVISTWIDEVGPGETKDPAELSQRCIAEVKECDCLLLFISAEDQPKGAFIEVGAALAFSKPIRVVAPFYRIGIFQHHPSVTQFTTVADALNLNPADCLL